MESGYAFHDGGAGPCEGCHTMHNSQGFTGEWLIPGTDPSSICLNCHAGDGSNVSYHVASPDGSAMTPGGDFYWLKKTFSWTGGSSVGENHGHNIIAIDYGFAVDASNDTAPGGTYRSLDLACTSCHDPHGKHRVGSPVRTTGSYGEVADATTVVGNYRLLGGTGYSGGGHVGGYSFINDAPIARQSATSPFGETDTSHVDYGSGMSEWCSNCHNGILNSEHKAGSGPFGHPIGNDALLGDVLDYYNTYVKTGDFSGNDLTSYLALVPFERGVMNQTLLNPTSTRGPDSSSNIMCLTCHRAHASAFTYAGRWDFTSQLVADSHPAIGDLGATSMDVYYSYYGRNMLNDFGPGQRILCEKCHTVPRDGYPPGW